MSNVAAPTLVWQPRAAPTSNSDPQRPSLRPTGTLGPGAEGLRQGHSATHIHRPMPFLMHLCDGFGVTRGGGGRERRSSENRCCAHPRKEKKKSERRRERAPQITIWFERRPKSAFESGCGSSGAGAPVVSESRRFQFATVVSVPFVT